MYNKTLVKGRQQAVMRGDVYVFDSNGNILVQDVQDNNIFVVPVCEEVLKFFNFRFTEEEPSKHNSGSNDDCIIESQGESMASQQGELTASQQSEFTVSSTASWKDDNEVKCLIHLWQDHQNDFKTMKSRDVWTLICQELKKTIPEGRKKTPIQCENKWKDLKRKYMETKDRNNKSGNDLKTCKFYDELEEILGEKPCIKPIAVASNLRKRKPVSSEENDFQETNEDSGSSTQNEEASKPQQKKKKLSRLQRNLQDWSAALLADTKAREEAKERRHREIIAESRVVVDVYKEVMGKLIDKL